MQPGYSGRDPQNVEVNGTGADNLAAYTTEADETAETEPKGTSDTATAKSQDVPPEH